MSDEERKKLQEKIINKLNPYKEKLLKKYFPNGGEICTEGRKKGDKNSVVVNYAN